MTLPKTDLPEQPGDDEAVIPWTVREALLDTGRMAAMRLQRSETELALVDGIVESGWRRGASELLQAFVLLNTYEALIGLGQLALHFAGASPAGGRRSAGPPAVGANGDSAYWATRSRPRRETGVDTEQSTTE